MAAPVEPPPSQGDDWIWCDADVLDSIADHLPDELPDWLLDDLYDDPYDDPDAPPLEASGVPGVDAPGEPSWAVPGVETENRADNGDGDGDDGEGGLSVGSVVVLAELAAAWQAQRLAQARCYRALTALQASDALGESGYRYTSRLLAEHVRVDTAEANRLAGHARALATSVSPTGAVIPAELPATAGLVTDGIIGSGHVEVIRRTLRRLQRVTPPIDTDTLATTETELAGLAATLTPAALAEAVVAIVALLDPDGTAPDDQPPPENELHYLRRRDGSLTGKFTYRDPAAAETLHTALGAATPPADVPEPPPADGRGPRGEPAGTHADRTLPERRAHALLDLAAEALTRGLNIPDSGEISPEDTSPCDLFAEDDDAVDPADTDPADTDAADTDAADTDAADRSSSAPAPPAWTRADVEGGERVALTLTLNYETLRGALTDAASTDPTLADLRNSAGDGYTGRLALLGENTWIRPETARRLACDAEIIPVVLGARGEPLDLGRKNRVATAALRRAVIQRDRHCAHPGCRRRARRCQVHHIRHWIDLGETCPENCLLLCAYHHTLIHHSGWQIHMIDGLPWFTPPAHIDPHRRPRHNRPWQPA